MKVVVNGGMDGRNNELVAEGSVVCNGNVIVSEARDVLISKSKREGA